MKRLISKRVKQSGYLNEQQQAIYFPLADSGKFNDKQLKVIKDCVEYNLDITNLADPNYTAEQMDVLESALFNGIDLTEFVNYNTTINEMNDILSDLVYDNLPAYFKTARKRLAQDNYPKASYEWVSNKVEELKKTSDLEEDELYKLAWEDYKR